MLAALQDLNAQRIEQCLNRLLRDYGHEAVISQLSDPLRQQLAASASLAMQRALLDSVLMQKWSARALSLVPGRRESGWLLVPFGDPLGVLELAMVMSSPVWCLSGPVAAQALAQQVWRERDAGGAVVGGCHADSSTAGEMAATGAASLPCQGVGAACQYPDAIRLGDNGDTQGSGKSVAATASPRRKAGVVHESCLVPQ